MTEIKRATFLFFYLADEICFDVEQFVAAGRIAFGTCGRLQVISILSECEFPFEWAHAEILGGLPSDRFIPTSEALERHHLTPELMQEWAEKGLVISDGSDPALVEYRRRDE